jgi:hypothetical protein
MAEGAEGFEDFGDVGGFGVGELFGEGFGGHGGVAGAEGGFDGFGAFGEGLGQGIFYPAAVGFLVWDLGSLNFFCSGGSLISSAGIRSGLGGRLAR